MTTAANDDPQTPRPRLPTVAPPPPSTSVQIEDLAARFTAGTLPKEEWTHIAHLVVGLWHVDRFPPATALERLRAGIRHLNQQHGTPNSDTRGYHETITRAYVHLLSAFAGTFPRGAPLEEKIARLLAHPLADRDHLLHYYSRDRLMSVAARRNWVEPDLKPLGEGLQTDAL